MEFTTEDFLKKAILDTQERVRDFMNYADKVEGNQELQNCFKEFAETEGKQAQKLQEFAKNISYHS